MDEITRALGRVFDPMIGVAIDSRSIRPGQIFFAIKGDRTDGHRYVEQAIEGGASLCVVSAEGFGHPKCLRVPDTLLALQELARWYRRKLSIPVIGITGSNGKTTTKELVTRVLRKEKRVYSTPGNYNNHIGVPLSVLGIPPECEMAVIEMGANHQGEIAFLSTIAMPTVGLITNVGKAHLEGFGGIEGVVKGKGELFEYLALEGRPALVNISENRLEEMSYNVQERIFYGFAETTFNSGMRYSFVRSGSDDALAVDFEDTNGQNWHVRSKLYGTYNYPNIATAIACGLYFGIKPGNIAAAIEDYEGSDKRSEVVHRGDKTIYLDAYNANPTSMHAALESFARVEGDKAVVIGEMKELGPDSPAEHKALVQKLATGPWNEVVLVGEPFTPFAADHGFVVFKNVDETREYLDRHPISSSSVLLKASRSVRLEELLDVFE